MRSRLPLLVAAGLFAISLIAWGLWTRGQEMLPPSSPASETLRADEPPPAPAMQRMPPAEPPPAEPSQPVEVAPLDERVTEAPEAHAEHAAAPTGDLEHYARRPMSAVPHRVIRGWGASDDGSQLGLVGAYVVVEPGISDAQLTQLCRDIQKYHHDAKVLSVRILDSAEAATYDRHIDGGALGNQHQVASVKRDPTLGVNDEIQVRGNLVKP